MDNLKRADAAMRAYTKDCGRRGHDVILHASARTKAELIAYLKETILNIQETEGDDRIIVGGGGWFDYRSLPWFEYRRNDNNELEVVPAESEA